MMQSLPMIIAMQALAVQCAGRAESIEARTTKGDELY